MIRLSSDRKNPTGVGIFSERRNSRFFGMMRDFKTFSAGCAFDLAASGLFNRNYPWQSRDSKGPLALWPGILKGKGFPLRNTPLVGPYRRPFPGARMCAGGSCHRPARTRFLSRAGTWLGADFAPLPVLRL